jgi:hypothetical protein
VSIKTPADQIVGGQWDERPAYPNEARNTAVYLLRQLRGSKLEEIGKEFGLNWPDCIAGKGPPPLSKHARRPLYAKNSRVILKCQ